MNYLQQVHPIDWHETVYLKAHIDPRNEETPGAATPGDPRDIPMGMDGYSMRSSIRMVKQRTRMSPGAAKISSSRPVGAERTRTA